MKQLPPVTVTITPDSMSPFKEIRIGITVQQHGRLPLHGYRVIDTDMFKSYFDQVMEELIDTIHRFYAEKGYIE